MTGQALGLAERPLQEVTRTIGKIANFRTRVISEEPRFRNLTMEDFLYHVPLPYVHYLFIQPDQPYKRAWRLLSIYMSPCELEDKASQPCLPNLYQHRPFFTPCQGKKFLSAMDINKVIAGFWGGNFNHDLAYPTVTTNEIRKLAVTNTIYNHTYMKFWESMSIEEMLALPWSQDIKI